MTKEEKRVKNKAYKEAHKEEISAYNKAYLKAYYKEHKEEMLAKQKAYYEAHREEKRAKGKAYYWAHKEEDNARCKAYRETHKEEKKAQYRAYQSTPKGRAVNLLAGYNREDREKGFDTSNNITADWIVTNIFSGQKCVYCEDSDWRHLGCDRIDNDKPHTPDNVVCCCGICNIERSDKYTHQEFIQYRQLHPRLLEHKNTSGCKAEIENGRIVLKKQRRQETN